VTTLWPQSSAVVVETMLKHRHW